MIAHSIKPKNKIYADDKFDKGIIFESNAINFNSYAIGIKDAIVVDGQHFMNPDIYDLVFWEVSLPNFQVQYINKSAERIFGRSVSDFHNTPNLIKSIVFDDDKEKFDEAINEAILYEKSVIKKRFVLPDGSVKYLYEKLYVSYDSSNKPITMYGISDLVNVNSPANLPTFKDNHNLHILLSNMKDVAFRTDAEGKWTYLNPAWEKLTGFTCDESIGKIFFDFLHPDDLVFNAFKFTPLINKEIQSVNHVVQFITKSGSKIETEIFASAIINHNDDTLGISGIIKDISSDSLTIEALKESDNRNKLLLNAIPDLFLVIDWEGFISDYYISDKSRLVFSQSEFINKPLSHIFPSDVADEFIRNIHYVINTDKKAQFDYSFHSGSNDIFYEAKISKLNSTKVVALIRNIDKQKETELKLEKQNSLHLLMNSIATDLAQSSLDNYRRIIDLSIAQLGIFTEVDRICIFSLNFDDRTCNNTYEWCAGEINPEITNRKGISIDLIPRMIDTFISNDYLYVPSVENMEEQYYSEMEILKQGTTKSVVFSPMYFNDALIGFIGFDSIRQQKAWDDETISIVKLVGGIFAATIKRFEYEDSLLKQIAQAEEANIAKSKYLANISQEIRIPLNAILSYSELLNSSPIEESNKEHINTISSNAQYLLSLMNSILELSKIEAGMIVSKFETMSVNVLLAEIRQIFAQKALDKGIELSIDVQDGFPDAIYFDDLNLKQILFSLVSNAIKFTENGAVKVSADITYGLGNGFVDMRFQVSDTGIGICESRKNAIFDSLSQVRSYDANQKKHDSGLGLTITKKLTSLLGGKINVRNDENIGSTFTVEFSKIKVSKETIVTGNQSGTNSNIIFEQSKILLIDDNEHNRELVKSYLAPCNLIVIEAINGHEAIDLIGISDIDLVLIDSRITLIDASLSAESIRQNVKLNQITTIGYESFTTDFDVEKNRDIFDYYLPKSFSKTELINCLTKFLPYKELKNTKSAYYKENDINFLVAQNLVDSIDRDVLKKFLDSYNNTHKNNLQDLLNRSDFDLILSTLYNFSNLTDRFGIEAFSDIVEQIKDSAMDYDNRIINESIDTILKSIDYCSELIHQ